MDAAPDGSPVGLYARLPEMGEGEVDAVLNLAAGLDTRPYRLELAATLRWIEADLPGINESKAQALAGEKPRDARGANSSYPPGPK